MLAYNELRAGVMFIYEDQPYIVLESNQLKMQQRRPVYQTKMRNLLNGKVIEHNFQQSDQLKEADIEKKNVKFLYAHRDEYWFVDEKDPSKRFKLDQAVLGDTVKFLKQNTVVEAFLWNGDIVNITLPNKMEFLVKEAPPSIKGNTAQGGIKQVVLETGATVNTPLFINEGDVIRVNTQTGEYTERVDKK